MADSYQKAIAVPATTGLTGFFLGFLNGATAQNVAIASPRIYNSSKVITDVTISVAAGQEVRVTCNKIVPVSHPVLAFPY
jgi:hypothetical protein